MQCWRRSMPSAASEWQPEQRLRPVIRHQLNHHHHRHVRQTGQRAAEQPPGAELDEALAHHPQCVERATGGLPAVRAHRRRRLRRQDRAAHLAVDS